ncbi:hypothetical protein B0H13DRAFT_2340166 [Mycena leptocephala]|nr:hypothetical protein B0H13DRAFT_2340166 [Mycena leptocephala]
MYPRAIPALIPRRRALLSAAIDLASGPTPSNSAHPPAFALVRSAVKIITSMLLHEPDSVPFILRYSSDRTRELFGTFPRLTPTRRTRLGAPRAEIELLNLYGSFDDKPRIQVQNLVNFCEKRCTKLFLPNKSDVEQYLHEFPSLAGPLVKQRDIIESQRALYFVAGIPRRIRDTFVSRVLEHQCTRFNPPSLTDAIGMFHEPLDEDYLFHDLRSEPKNEQIASQPSKEPSPSFNSPIHQPAHQTSRIITVFCPNSSPRLPLFLHNFQHRPPQEPNDDVTAPPPGDSFEPESHSPR